MGKGGESRNNKSVEVEHHGSPVPIALIENQSCCGMMDLCRLIGWTVVDLLRSLQGLRQRFGRWQQVNVLRRAAPKNLLPYRLIFVGLFRLFPKVCGVLAIVKPDTSPLASRRF
jgi:hypothetical protein